MFKTKCGSLSLWNSRENWLMFRVVILYFRKWNRLVKVPGSDSWQGKNLLEMKMWTFACYRCGKLQRRATRWMALQHSTQAADKALVKLRTGTHWLDVCERLEIMNDLKVSMSTWGLETVRCLPNIFTQIVNSCGSKEIVVEDGGGSNSRGWSQN